MNFTKKLFRASLLLAAAALFSIPMAALQDVNPDHFYDNPPVAKKQKPAAKPSAAKRSSSNSQTAPKAKTTHTQASLRADNAPVQTAVNPR
jgi:hypothetical protein